MPARVLEGGVSSLINVPTSFAAQEGEGAA
jgi:hypothetical protein